jgi:hypothetical protein
MAAASGLFAVTAFRGGRQVLAGWSAVRGGMGALKMAGTAVAEGDFRADLDTEQLAFTLQGLMLGYHHAARLMRDPKALDHTRRALDQLLEASAA